MRKADPMGKALVTIVLAGESIGLLTHVLVGLALIVVLTATVMLRRMRADVRALEAWSA